MGQGNKILLMSVLGALSLLLVVGTAGAQSFECDDNYGECGTPELSGGGGCGGGSILINNTDLGDTYQFADDYDDDGHEDPFDNCPFVSNRDQADDDGDEVGTGCDNCPNASNEDQSDIDADGLGDVCDEDMDGDSVLNVNDLCPANPDPLQLDTNNDGEGDACDEDMDGDGVDNLEDNCPLVPNSSQSEEELATLENCDRDDDGDLIWNTNDNCPTIANEDQMDVDYDGLGDVCDSDRDNDGIFNPQDNCIDVANPDQEDADRDGLGELCDDRYCYVVYNDVANCLDKEAAFRIYSPSVTGVETGEDFRLRLFANREMEPMRYTWRIDSAPAGSNASIENPKGAVNESSPYEYRYIAGEEAILTPDKPGDYRIQVTAELAFEDPVTGEEGVKAETFATIEVSGDAIGSGGCSVVPVGQGSQYAVLPLLLLALGVLLRRR
jgi:MYXO-CTERM domain-containing protein